MRHVSTGMVSIVRLHPGDELVASLEAALRESHTQHAIVQFGIGSLALAEFGVLPEQGPHARHRLKGPAELVYLGGLIVGRGGAGPYSSHIHIALASADGLVRGGHLFEATVGVAAEVAMSPVHDFRLRRIRDEARKLELLDI